MKLSIQPILTIAIAATMLGGAALAHAKGGGNAGGGNAGGANSARDFAPGQEMQAAGASSAKQYAPGQKKRAAGAKNAKQYAPGQSKKPTNGTATTGNQTTTGR